MEEKTRNAPTGRTIMGLFLFGDVVSLFAPHRFRTLLGGLAASQESCLLRDRRFAVNGTAQLISPRGKQMMGVIGQVV